MSPLILVVDDEPDVEVLFRQQFRHDLRAGRFTMDFAQSGDLALRRIANAKDVSLILIPSDINMPGMTGLELLPKAKAARPDVPIIMITAYGDGETKRKALENGAENAFSNRLHHVSMRSMQVAALSELREKPAGTIRITAGEHPAYTVLWPAIDKFLPAYPDIKVEIVVDYGLTDIVAERYDAGVRLGEQVARDMIAVRIGPDMRMAVVGAPSYFERRPKPKQPQDLTAHDCINLRLPTHGGLYAWEFEKGGRELRARVEGQLVFNNLGLRLRTALAGRGLAYLPEDQVKSDVADGRLVRVLSDWCPTFAGYHLYYPSRRQATPAFSLLVDALRYRR